MIREAFHDVRCTLCGALRISRNANSDTTAGVCSSADCPDPTSDSHKEQLVEQVARARRDQVRVLQENVTMQENLSRTQARCTELLNENRRLRRNQVDVPMHEWDAQVLQPLEQLLLKAFVGPWTYEDWIIACEDSETNCECGDDHEVATVRSPHEYPQPDGQVVAQIDDRVASVDRFVFVPGMQSFADDNGRAIVALRNSAPLLIEMIRRLTYELEVAKRK